ncbi:MAG: ABC transporter permease [Bacteroidota bacterium]
MNLLISLRGELLKTKRTASIYLTIIAAAFGPLMTMLELLLDGFDGEDQATILEQLFTSKFQMTGLMIFPFFIMLICTLLPQIEYKNNAWKQVLTSPQTKANVFMAKFINVQLLILVFLVANQLLMFVGAVVLHVLHPALHVLNQPIDGKRVFAILVNNYAALLAICCIQFWLGIRFRNFIVPLAVGFACWLAGTILGMNFPLGFAKYYPYAFHMYPNFSQYKAVVPAIAWTSLGYSVLFLVLGYLDFRRRRMDT